MSKALTTPADDETEDARDPLIPIPAIHGSPWLPLAQAISEQYLAEKPQATFDEPTGRASHLANPDIVCVMLHAATNGLSATQAAVYAGISEQTMRRWLDRGEKQPDSAFGRFCDALKMAREDRRSRLLQTIERASTKGPQYWPAAAWSLERGYGNDYKLNSDKQPAQVVVNVGVFGAGDIQVGGESAGHNTHPDIVIPTKPVESTT